MKIIFDSIERLLQQSDMRGMLVAYKEDFYVTDREALCQYGSPAAEYIWSVRPTGTGLHRLYVDPSVDEWVHAGLESHLDQRHFHVGVSFVREVTAAQVKSLLKRKDYVVGYTATSAQVTYKGRVIADLWVKPDKQHFQQPKLDIELASKLPLSVDHATSLRLIAIAEAARQFSMWAGINSLTLDGLMIDDAIRELRIHADDGSELILA